MKKLFIAATILFACTAAWTSASAQHNVDREVNYYGVDFSKAKTFGAQETGEEFKAAFGGINYLVIYEWSKYNPGRFLHKKIVVRDVEVAQAWNDAIDPENIAMFSPNYALTDGDIAEMVESYEIAETEGTGLIILGELLNKPDNAGSFVFVYFDIATRKVLYSQHIVGGAGGFGLRNYWARALYNALRFKLIPRP